MITLALKPLIERGSMGNIVRHGPDHHSWKGDVATKKAGSSRARRWYAIGNCENCGKVASDRHHKDGNTLNNTASNLQALCRKCHMEADGRLARFSALPKDHLKRPALPCENCGMLSKPKPLRKGRCHKCDMFLRKRGIEWTPERASRRRRRSPDRFCANCGVHVPHGWSKGRCVSCRHYFKAHGIERRSNGNQKATTSVTSATKRSDATGVSLK